VTLANRPWLCRVSSSRRLGGWRLRPRAAGHHCSDLGQSTQEDPIGLAGGVNLYGFAAGDPVNFSDPFGLCPQSAGGDGTTEDFDDCPPGSSGWYAHRAATGVGYNWLNNVGGALASCGESGACMAALSVAGISGSVRGVISRAAVRRTALSSLDDIVANAGGSARRAVDLANAAHVTRDQAVDIITRVIKSSGRGVGGVQATAGGGRI
jgi:hypothetical protein